jgi:hypothetical protein
MKGRKGGLEKRIEDRFSRGCRVQEQITPNIGIVPRVGQPRTSSQPSMLSPMLLIIEQDAAPSIKNS